jgi:hypothetical protein
MTPEAAARIQSSTDKKGGGDGFKERAQSAGAKNEAGKGGGGGKSGGGGNKGGGKK